MASRRLSAAEPALAPALVNWAGAPAIMVHRYAPQPRLRLRDLEPLPDDTLWDIEEVFTAPARRFDRVQRALGSLVVFLIVLDLGALLVRSAQARNSRSTMAAVKMLSPMSLAPPLIGPVLTSSTTAPPALKMSHKAAPSRTTGSKTSAAHSTKAPAAPVSASGTWGCIIQHESGGNPRAVYASSGAGGLFQFLPSSWTLYGGTGLPQNATVQEQWRIANNAYARSGFSPWRGDGCV
ncbi:MAG TPA: transglycosylase family protein [Acidimicrobiales bacterium]